MSSAAAGFPLAYRTVVAVGRPIMAWSRLTVTGLENLPATGPALVVADHDSYWDPIAIAVAAREVRHIRALAKSTLWKVRPIGRCMDSMGHIPIERGVSNAVALQSAIDELAAGACIGIFPEATRSLGKSLRAKSGVGRLAAGVPEATVVLARTNGTTDVVRLPKRPAITVEFLRPAGGQWQPGESVTAFADRLLAELRDGAPVEIPGRRRAAAKFRAGIDAS
jgi:1-acyl-sn-glycerol-3-phosphate acyltransferase